ncbi:MAG: hypothetical protein M0D57_13685 [Sphingobacteriales bacterium JAD_PAG50586_3]|nr:MAG: hypothetical protein M0D57_13685 [Sphingobacteriales bacterium JAD_PAG50586_3]
MNKSFGKHLSNLPVVDRNLLIARHNKNIKYWCAASFVAGIIITYHFMRKNNTNVTFQKKLNEIKFKEKQDNFSGGGNSKIKNYAAVTNPSGKKNQEDIEYEEVKDQ